QHRARLASRGRVLALTKWTVPISRTVSEQRRTIPAATASPGRAQRRLLRKPARHVLHRLVSGRARPGQLAAPGDRQLARPKRPRDSADAPLVPFPVRLAQLALEHLAARVARQRVDEVDRARTLVAAQPCLAEREQLLRRRGRSGLRDDDRLNRLP